METCKEEILEDNSRFTMLDRRLLPQNEMSSRSFSPVTEQKPTEERTCLVLLLSPNNKPGHF